MAGKNKKQAVSINLRQPVLHLSRVVRVLFNLAEGHRLEKQSALSLPG